MYSIGKIVIDSDKELIAHLLSDDAGVTNKAWQHIYNRYFPMVMDLIVKSKGTDQDAIDIFQDSLLILNRNLRNGTFRGDSSVKTYIFSISKNLWLKEYYKKQKHAFMDANHLLENFQEEVNYLANVDVVSKLMTELKEECRKILTEYYYNKRSMEELKDIFKVNSIQAAKNKKWRCLGYLIKLFKERGITYLQLMEMENE